MASTPFSDVFKKYQKQAFRTDLSISDIRGLAWNASQGSEMSYDILREQNRKLAKIANSRLLQLEKAGYDMFSYDRAFTYLQNQGRRRFSTKLPSPGDYKSTVAQMQELVTFINSRTSTLAGAKTALTKKIEKISEFTGHTYSDAQAYKLGRLLGTDSVSTLLREVRGNSEEVLEILEEVSATDANLDQLVSIIDKYLQGYQPWGDNSDYLTYDELMDELRRTYEEEI